jgi:hypothetical protein
MSARRRRLLLGRRERDEFHLTANPEVGSLNVRLKTIASSVPTVIAWGDGATTAVPADTTVDVTHTYGAAGSYRITIPHAQYLTKIDLRDGKLSGLNTRELRACRHMHTFRLDGDLSGVVNSADMTGWGLSYQFVLNDCPNVTGTLNSADMTGWGLSYQFFLYNCPNITGTLNSAGMTGWGLSYRLYLHDCPNVTYACSNPAHIVWTGIGLFRASDVSCTLATVENVIQGFWDLRDSITRATPELDLGGASNATPGGAYQSACPPTSALEQVYNLVNAQCAGDTHQTWAAISWNGGSAP